jgi:N-acetylneuraminate lyase
MMDEYQTLLAAENGRFCILFGRDEMLLSGLASGAPGAVGSTYNFAAPLYRKVMTAFERGDVKEARRLQGLAVEMVRVILRYRGHAGLKAVMALLGMACGPNRLPIVALTAEERENLRLELEAIGFFHWGIGKE